MIESGIRMKHRLGLVSLVRDADDIHQLQHQTGGMDRRMHRMKETRNNETGLAGCG